MNRFSKNFKAKAKKGGGKKSDLVKYIETNSTVAPTGKVIVISNGKKKAFDYFAPKPNGDVLKAFVDTLKLPNVSKYWYE